jgi:hypothetical protein
MSELESMTTAADAETELVELEEHPLEAEWREACRAAGIDYDRTAFPWRGLHNLPRIWSRGLSFLLFSLIRAADKSRCEWRGVACHLAAEACWQELQRRGCRGLDGTKGGDGV